ncbi:MAG: hypothetical protein CME62_12580 [Halobacteriovoraceae bacterium]|nr:hypothetical protein [Halobacteriovoraceae bacterium]|tara:strand:- start:10307 stop:11425 length:1119 start_codon:yes stop_codon:yes gene_type:complete
MFIRFLGFLSIVLVVNSSADELKLENFKIGARLQGMGTFSEDDQDFFLRRTRLNISYKLNDESKIVYDIRNDNSNQEDRGDGEFAIGDAYWQRDINQYTIKNIRFFRAKVDVSYSQTSSSKNLFNPERTIVAELASDFVVQNRRANNIQLNGNFHKAAYQLVVSDGVQSSDLEDLNGNEIDSVQKQKLTYGGKIRYFFIGDASKNKAQDTFYGQVDTFSLGYGLFLNDRIEVENTAGGLQEFNFSRKLQNVELSYANKYFRILAEHFSYSNDLIDLTAQNKEDILTDSVGSYIQGEIYIGHWAPYLITEKLTQDEDSNGDERVTNSTTAGLNYYPYFDESLRFGAFTTSTEFSEALDKDDEYKYGLYIMLDV